MMTTQNINHDLKYAPLYIQKAPFSRHFDNGPFINRLFVTYQLLQAIRQVDSGSNPGRHISR